MSFKQSNNKSLLFKAGNYLFFGVVLFLLFNPNAKSWLLRQFMGLGLFKAEIKKEELNTNLSANSTGFYFRNENGNIVSTRELKGKVVFINFWATWCPPCRAEMPALNDLYNQLQKDAHVVFLFLNEDNDPVKATEYLKNNGFTIPLATTSDSVPAEIYSGTLPTTVILNTESKIIYHHEGLAKYNTKDFIDQLKALR